MQPTDLGKLENDFSTEEVVVLDFETTGLSPNYERIIEVAAIKIKNGKVTGQFVELMNPGKTIPYFISDLTGITNEMVAKKPHPEKIMPHLKDFLGNSPIIAHNASFDKKFLLSEMERVNISIDNPFFCTMSLSRKLIPNIARYTLGSIANHLKITSVRQHRALDDVLVTAKVWDHLNLIMCEKSGVKETNFSLISAINKKPKKTLESYFAKINVPNH